jgi:two-component system response regulator FixJ
MNAGKILVVDDDRSFARSVSLLLGSEGYRCRSSHDAAGALALARSHTFDCALIDYNLGATLGTALLAKFGEEGHGFAKIMLTGFGDVRAATLAMKLGAVDFIEKCSPPEELLEAIAEATSRTVLSRWAEDSVREARRMLRLLTDRESEIVDAIAAGYSNKQIADALAVSPRTVEAHRANALHKLGVSNTAALVRLAVLSGLGAPEA